VAASSIVTDKSRDQQRKTNIFGKGHLKALQNSPAPYAPQFCSAVYTLELRYVFESDDPTRVVDVSGHGRDGQIKGTANRQPQGQSKAFIFDGETRIECGPILPEKMRLAGTIEAWGRMDRIGGAFFSCHTGPGNRWHYLILRLGTIMWQDSRILAALGKGASEKPGDLIRQIRADVRPGEWAHWVMTWDGRRFCLYRNGTLLDDIAQGVIPNVTDEAPCYVGFGGNVPNYFKGRIAEVSVYSKALSPKDVEDRFRQGIRHLKINDLRKVRTSCLYDHKNRQMVAEVDISDVSPLPENSAAMVVLKSKRGETIAKKTVPVAPNETTLNVHFDTENLRAGEHLVDTRIVDGNGQTLYEIPKTVWYYQDLAAKAVHEGNVRVLNNMVFEILHEKDILLDNWKEPRTWTFNLPYSCWVYMDAKIQTEGRASTSIGIDHGMQDAMLHFHVEKEPRQQAMRYLQAGEHTVYAWKATSRKDPAQIKELTLRIIPETVFGGIPNASRIGTAYLDFDRLEEDVLPYVTSLYGGGEHVDFPALRLWKARGRRFYREFNIPTLLFPKDMPKPLTADYAYDWWMTRQGFAHHLFDGTIADEFLGSGSGPAIQAYHEAIKRIAADPKYQDRAVHIFGAGLYNPSDTHDMLETVHASGYKTFWELYLAECSSEEKADDALKYIKEKMAKWEKGYPGMARFMVPTLATFSTPILSVDAWPQSDFKVHLDKQVHYLATAPEFFALYGLSMWKANYSDEEYLRWFGRLLQHYCIEGKTNFLSDEYGYKYRPGIILNSDFSNGLENWNIDPAESDSITTGTLSYMGNITGYWHIPEAGQTYVAIQRSTDKANALSQTLKNTKPGQYISVKVTAMHLDEAIAGKGIKPAPEISAALDGAERIEDRSYNIEIDSKIGNIKLRHIRYVYKINRPLPELVIKDWTGESPPGELQKQTAAINFVQVAPYFK
jgi:hypothetical protein